MDTTRILDSFLGGSRGNALGGRGLDGLLDAFGGGGRPMGTPRAGMEGPHMGGGRSSGGLGGGGLGDLLGGLLGGGRAPSGPMGGGGGLGGALGGMLGGGLRPPLGNAAGAAAAGGLLGSILGGGRNGGGLLRVGGMGILGMLAYRAYEQWKAQQGGAARTAPTPATGEFAQAEAPAGNGQPFGLAVIRAMIAAAKSDGTLDERERERIFGEAERLELDPAAKGLVFEALRAEPDPAAIAAAARTDAQRAELYLASAMVTQDGGATSSERAYLDALAHHLRLETGLRRTLDDQAREAAEVARSLPETR